MSYLPKLNPTIGGGLGGLPERKSTGIDTKAYSPPDIAYGNAIQNILPGYKLAGSYIDWSTAHPRLQSLYPKIAGYSQTAYSMPAYATTKIVYNNGIFLYISSGTVYTSTDFVSWNSTASLPNAVSSLIVANGLFIIADTAYTIRTSPDGITWTYKAYIPGPAANTQIAYNPTLNMYAAISGAYGTDVSYIRTSTDLVTWTTRSLPVSDWYSSVVVYNGIFLTAVTSGTHSKTTAAYSTDGITWIACSLPTPGAFSSLTATDKGFVISGGDSDRFSTSQDGVTWTTPIVLPETTKEWGTRDYQCRYLAYGNGVYIITAENSGSTTCLTSTDGINWNSQALGFTPLQNLFVTFVEQMGVFVVQDGTLNTVKKITLSDGGALLYLNGAAGNYIRILE